MIPNHFFPVRKNCINCNDGTVVLELGQPSKCNKCDFNQTFEAETIQELEEKYFKFEKTFTGTWHVTDGYEDETEEYNTLPKAINAAEDLLTDYRDNSDEGWPEGGPDITIAKVTHHIQEKPGSRRKKPIDPEELADDEHIWGDYDEIVDYELAPVDPEPKYVYLVIYEDNTPYSIDKLESCHTECVIDGVMDIFRMHDGKFEQMTGDDKWEPVEKIK